MAEEQLLNQMEKIHI